MNASQLNSLTPVGSSARSLVIDSKHTSSLLLPLAIFVVHCTCSRGCWRRASLSLPHRVDTSQRHWPCNPGTDEASPIPPSPDSAEPIKLELFRQLLDLRLCLVSALDRPKYTHTLQHSSHRLCYLCRTRVGWPGSGWRTE